jgi:hypothetical protein
LRGFFDGQHSLVQLLPTDSKVEANRMKAGVVELMLEQIQLAARQHKFMAEQDNVCLFSVLYFAERRWTNFAGFPAEASMTGVTRS